MDNNELLHYRLKTARRKRRLQKLDLDKQILKLAHEQKQLLDDPELVKTIPLDEPYQRGYIRLFVLTSEAEKSPQAEFYQQILNTINDVQYHYDASFKKTKRKQNRHRYNYDLPVLKPIESYRWSMNKMELSPEQKECFRAVPYFDDYRYRWTCKYEFMYPELFTVKVLPNMVTTVKLRDMEMEKRIDFINDYLKKNKFNNRLAKIRGGWYKYWKGDFEEKSKYINPLKGKHANKLVEMFY